MFESLPECKKRRGESDRCQAASSLEKVRKGKISRAPREPGDLRDSRESREKTLESP